MSKPGLPKFPHFTRLFSALPGKRLLGGMGKTFLWILLIFCTLINLALNPATSDLVDRAAHQLRFALGLIYNNKPILGASDIQRADDTALQKTYEYWIGVIRDHPDYRDGYYMAATLAFQLGNISASREFINAVKRLDPNYPGIKQLEELFSEK